jgi:hypothetical protein
MIATIKTGRQLKRILTIILTLYRFSKIDVTAFCQGHISALKHGIMTVEKQVMIDEIELVYKPFHTNDLIKGIDAGEMNTSVKIIAGSKTYIISELKDLITKINTITHNDDNIIIKFHLNKKSLFYTGKESKRKKYFGLLKKGMSLNPDFAPLMPQVTLFVKTVTDLYKDKSSKKINIKTNVSDMRTLIDPVAKVLLINYNKLQIINIDNLELVNFYYPYTKMHGRKKAPDFTFKYQTLVKIPYGKLLNVPSIKFKYKNFLKIENKSKGMIRIFLSNIPNPKSIPDYAELCSAGSKIVIPFESIGTSTQLYLIFACVTPGEEAVLKVSVRKTK